MIICTIEADHTEKDGVPNLKNLIFNIQYQPFLFLVLFYSTNVLKKIKCYFAFSNPTKLLPSSYRLSYYCYEPFLKCFCEKHTAAENILNIIQWNIFCFFLVMKSRQLAIASFPFVLPDTFVVSLVIVRQ